MDATQQPIAASPLWSRALPPGPDARVKITEDYASLSRATPISGLADGQRLQPPAAFASVKQSTMQGPLLRRRSIARHADRLHRAGGAHGRLSQPGRGLRLRRARARRLAGGDPGAGFRRPLLGLPGRRPAHRQLRAARQDVRHEARLLPAGRARTGRARCPRASRKVFRSSDQYRRSSFRASSRTTRRRTSARSSRVLPGS